MGINSGFKGLRRPRLSEGQSQEVSTYYDPNNLEIRTKITYESNLNGLDQKKKKSDFDSLHKVTVTTRHCLHGVSKREVTMYQ